MSSQEIQDQLKLIMQTDMDRYALEFSESYRNAFELGFLCGSRAVLQLKFEPYILGDKPCSN